MNAWVMEKINTPLKRVGLLTLLSGIILFVIGVIIMFYDVRYDRYQYGYNESEYFLRYLDGLTNQVTDSLGFNTSSSSYNFFLSAGFYVALAGFVFSFAYDKGVGRLVSWVSKG